MELYLFIALFLIYILTSLMADKAVIRKVWLAAFLVSFVVTAVAVSFLRFSANKCGKPCLPKLPAKTMTRERRMMSSFS